jgi:hypothetical protein
VIVSEPGPGEGFASKKGPGSREELGSSEGSDREKGTE